MYAGVSAGFFETGGRATPGFAIAPASSLRSLTAFSVAVAAYGTFRIPHAETSTKVLRMSYLCRSVGHILVTNLSEFVAFAPNSQFPRSSLSAEASTIKALHKFFRYHRLPAWRNETP